MQTTTVDEKQHVDQAKQTVRRLVVEISRLAKSDVEAAEFYTGFLDRVIRAMNALGGVVWSLDDRQSLKLQHEIRLHQSVGYLDREADEQHRSLLADAIRHGEGIAVAANCYRNGDANGRGVTAIDEPAADQKSPRNPTDCLILLQPIVIDGQCIGLVEIFHEAHTKPTVQNGYQRFLSQTCESAADYERSRRWQDLVAREDRWEELARFSHRVHATLNPRVVTFMAANEGRRLIGCDRVSIVVRHGRHLRVEAISGHEVVNQRANAVRSLAKLAATVAETGQPLIYRGDTSAVPGEMETALCDYLEQSGSQELLVLPLADFSEDGEPLGRLLGTLIAERFGDSDAGEHWVQLATTIAGHTETSLASATRHQQIFLLPLWRWLGRTTNPRRRFPVKLVFGALLLTSIATALTAIPADFNIESQGVVVPRVRREVFAAEPGDIREVKVEHGMHVKQGDVLAVMQNTELEIRLQQIRGQLTDAEVELAIKEAQLGDRDLTDSERIQLGGKLASLRKLQSSLRSEIELLQDRKQRLTIRSPIDGIVLTWDPVDRLTDRPVQPGNRLLTVAEDGAEDGADWTLELKLKEDRSGHVLRTWRESSPDAPPPVEYILATQPEHKFHGHIETIAGRAEITETDGSFVKVAVGIDPAESVPLRSGAEVRAHIHCGRRPIGYVWFHELIEFVYSRVLF